MDIKERQQKIEDAKIEENHQKIEESLQDIGDKQRNTRRNIREPRIKVSEKLRLLFITPWHWLIMQCFSAQQY